MCDTFPDDASCPRCASFNVENVENGPRRYRGQRHYNFCHDCRKLSEYLPTKATIARETERLGHCDQRRSPTHGVGNVLDKIKRALAEADNCRDVAERFGLSLSTIHKISAGLFDHSRPTRQYCRGCRQFVTEQPCVTCRARRAASVLIPRPMLSDRRYATNPAFHLTLAETGLDTRTLGVLSAGGFHYVAQFLAASDRELIAVPQVRRAVIARVDWVLAKLGMRRARRRARESAEQRRLRNEFKKFRAMEKLLRRRGAQAATCAGLAAL